MCVVVVCIMLMLSLEEEEEGRRECAAGKKNRENSRYVYFFSSAKKITKSIMSPQVLNSKEKFEINNSKDKEFKKFKDDLSKLRNFVEKNFEFVGDKFAKKVRDIYYDKNENQRIYGTTTPEEREELLEEGIELTSIPWVNKEN